MSLIVDHQHAAGFVLPAAMHRVRRIVLDLDMRAATIEVSVYANREAFAQGKPPVPGGPLTFVCQNTLAAAVEDQASATGYSMPSASNAFDDWFSPEGLGASGRNIYAQAEMYLRTSVPLYQNAEEA